MSELTNIPRNCSVLRSRLLMGASAFALVSLVGVFDGATAEEGADRPIVWLEVGAQTEQVNGFGGAFDVLFAPKLVEDGFKSPIALQRVLSQSFGEEGKLSFQPADSDWVFSIAARYGRAQSRTEINQKTPEAPKLLHVGSYPGSLFTPFRARYADTITQNIETHAILDFQAGKDVGLGLFGSDAKSVLGFGVRFAQLTSKQTLGMHADPDYYLPSNLKYKRYHHVYAVSSQIQRGFRGVGPSISWNASAPVMGHAENGVLDVDWGIDASVLFGRQKVAGHHQTIGTFYKTGVLSKYHFTSHPHRSGNPNRTRSVTVPNVGGFAGISYCFPNAKLSIGYRADLFFNAMDVGVDKRKVENVGFYGPFATISIGVGG